MKSIKVGGIWIKDNRLFLKIGDKFYNAYVNESKTGKQPDYNIVFGKEDKKTKYQNTS